MKLDFSKIIIIMTMLTQLSKYIKELVKSVEEEDIDDGVQHGEEKKDLVLQIVDIIYDAVVTAVGQLPLAKEKVMDLAAKLVDAFVSFFNAINVFRSKSK